MKQYELYIFDVDGTLVERDTMKILDGVEEFFSDLPQGTAVALATNQGGVGLRSWMLEGDFGNPLDYPSESDVWDKLESVEKALNKQFGEPFLKLVCFAYQSKSSGKWSPTPDYAGNNPEWNPVWRKPSPGMLIYAMDSYHIHPQDTVMVGDSDEDREAAERAGIDFILANDFFNRL